MKPIGRLTHRRLPRHPYRVAPDAVFRSFWKDRALIHTLVRREISTQHKGSVLGFGWVVLQPLILLGIYTLIFGKILHSRWANTTSTSDFALTLFIGLIVFNFFGETVARSPFLITSQRALVSKVVFPLEAFTWVSVGSSLFRAAVSFGVWIAGDLFFEHRLYWTIVFLPLILFPLVLGVAGISWFLASIGTFFRDTGQLIGLITTGLLFLSPVFFDLSVIPEETRGIFYLNPMTFFIEESRAVAIYGKQPDYLGILLAFAFGTGLAWAGLFYFQRTRHGFADVL